MLEEVNFYLAAFVLLFIVCDYVSGLIKAVKNENLSSSKMKDGLFHKIAFILALLLGYACQAATDVFSLPDAFGVIYPGVAMWIVLTELASIFENLVEINPEIAKSPLANLISSANDGNANEEGGEE